MQLNLLELRGAEVAAAVLTALLAALGFFTPAFKWAAKQLRALINLPSTWRRFSDDIKGLNNTLVAQAEQAQTNGRLLRELLAEIRPNGGSSLRDAVDRIEKVQVAHGVRQRVILSLSQDAYFETDPAGSCVYVNHRWEELTGLTVEESRGFGWLHGVHPEDRGVVLLEWKAAVSDKRPFRLSFRFQHVLTEEITPVFVRATAMSGPANTTMGYLGSAAIMLTDMLDSGVQTQT